MSTGSSTAGTVRSESATSFRVHSRGIEIQFQGSKLNFIPERFWQFMGLMSEAARQFAAVDIRKRTRKSRRPVESAE